MNRMHVRSRSSHGDTSVIFLRVKPTNKTDEDRTRTDVFDCWLVLRPDQMATSHRTRLECAIYNASSFLFTPSFLITVFASIFIRENIESFLDQNFIVQYSSSSLLSFIYTCIFSIFFTILSWIYLDICMFFRENIDIEIKIYYFIISLYFFSLFNI